MMRSTAGSASSGPLAPPLQPAAAASAVSSAAGSPCSTSPPRVPGAYSCGAKKIPGGGSRPPGRRVPGRRPTKSYSSNTAPTEWAR